MLPAEGPSLLTSYSSFPPLPKLLSPPLFCFFFCWRRVSGRFLTATCPTIHAGKAGSEATMETCPSSVAAPAGHIIILQLSSHSAANLYLLLSLSALLLIFLSAAFSCHPSLPSCLIFASCSFSVSPFLPKSLTMTGTAGNRDLWGLGREALGDCVGWRTEAPLRSLPSLASSWYLSPSLTICISSWALP